MEPITLLSPPASLLQLIQRPRLSLVQVPLPAALTANYTVGGTATNGTDYTSIPTSVTFAANSATATVTVDPKADTTVESNETVILTLASGTGYTIGTTTPVTGTITNDDVTLPNITLAVSPSSLSSLN